MRFLLGLVIGFAVGFAGAILLAPQASPIRGKSRAQDPTRAAINDFGGNSHDSNRVQELIKSLQEHIGEAFKEAKKASGEAEKEIHTRFEEIVAKQPIDEE
ncbi:MAG: YtxH domain-containing protein [Chloroflexi bacterium]|nr:YtxH domain-containing protein [Chloroflexota bacterium]